MRLIDKEALKGDTDPKALAAYMGCWCVLKKSTGKSESGGG